MTGYRKKVQDGDESFIRSLNEYTPISKEEEYTLIGHAQTDDARALKKLLEQHNRQILQIAKRFRGRGVALWDLFSEGRIGLLKAIEKFDMDRGFRLSTYASWWIRQMMTRAVQNQGRTIRIPVHAHEFHNKVVCAIRELKRDNGSDESPSDKAIAEWMYYYGTLDEDDGYRQKLVEKIHATRTSQSFLDTLSLEAPVDDGEQTQLKELVQEEIVPSAIEALLDGEHRDTINRAIDQLRPKEKYVIHMRFFLGWTLDRIAKTMFNRRTGKTLTRERVRQIEELAKKKLQSMLHQYHLTILAESRL